VSVLSLNWLLLLLIMIMNNAFRLVCRWSRSSQPPDYPESVPHPIAQRGAVYGRRRQRCVDQCTRRMDLVGNTDGADEE